ncbi:phospholipase D-like domain-containing protein [Altererythrobacter arenosus]|uniref:Phospholipase D n=2 Tax=Altererythrobacter arenosus TaxID=3032592 RepID=A0ABY8FW84_9SPHN|nr:phospholipase D-like domain-containing protein [Altererythrobacter sp. CAU 1644]WFL79097.1 phospholipase D-like domain-containing protein [Altererythrobacter sp. CAU 1644]
MQKALCKARQRALLIGWDFDTRIHLDFGRRWWDKLRSRENPSRLGSFIVWLTRHNKNLEVRILRWGYGVLKFLTRGSMTLDLLRWWPHRRIDFEFDTSHPVGASHHQKIVIIDDHLAVCGGIDMTTQRWDTREHKEVEPRRKRPRGLKYGPWHDATMMIEGDAARSLRALGEERWRRADGPELKPVERCEDSAWPDELEAQFENVEIGIARTRGAFGDVEEVMEIAKLFEKQIAECEHFIYAESQYFASRRIADALCKRLSEPNPPEVLIVHPEHADGWLEQQAMDHARGELVRTLGEVDPANRFNLYVPFTGETPIYVHAKIMIVDDKILRIGSANMNNRSLGLDSECDVFIDARRAGNEHAAEQIARVRYSLLAEHCGLDEEAVPGLISRYGSMSNMIENIGNERSRTLRRFELEEVNAAQETIAESGLLDPETPDELFEPFAKGGLFRKGSRLERIRKRLKGK